MKKTETQMRRAIRTNHAPAPLAGFSQGLISRDLIQVSGQGPLDAASGVVITGDVKDQTRITLMNIDAILTAGGTTLRDALMVRVYLTTRDLFEDMNEAYEEFMSDRLGESPRPARTTVIVGLPLEGMLVEIDVLAYRGHHLEGGS